METFNSFANINASVVIFEAMNKVSKQQLNQWNDTIMPVCMFSLTFLCNIVLILLLTFNFSFFFYLQ